MITKEIIQKLATSYRSANELNIIREYFQHLFLSQLYKCEGAEKILFKGGTALRVIYGSPRFSEDLDFSIFNIEIYKQKEFTENLFAETLAEIEKSGIKVNLGEKPGPTKEGYYGDATFTLYDYPAVKVEINVSSRNGREVQGEIDSIANDFVPTYNLYHLPQEELVEEKVFGALLERGKARDFYDLYFIMRKNFLTQEQKKRLATKKDEILGSASKINFDAELSVFLPSDLHDIIKNFPKTLNNEMNRQLGDTSL